MQRTLTAAGMIVLIANAAFGLVQPFLTAILGNLLGVEALIMGIQVINIIDNSLLLIGGALIAAGLLKAELPAAIVSAACAFTALLSIVIALLYGIASAGGASALYTTIAVGAAKTLSFAALLIFLGRGLSTGWRVISIVAAGVMGLSLAASISLSAYAYFTVPSGNVFALLGGAGNAASFLGNILCIAFSLGYVLTGMRKPAASDADGDTARSESH